MASRSTVVVYYALAAGAAVVAFTPGLSNSACRRAVGIVARRQPVAQRDAKPTVFAVQACGRGDGRRADQTRADRPTDRRARDHRKTSRPCQAPSYPIAGRVAHVSVKAGRDGRGTTEEYRRRRFQGRGHRSPREPRSSRRQERSIWLPDFRTNCSKNLTARDKSLWEGPCRSGAAVHQNRAMRQRRP